MENNLTRRDFLAGAAAASALVAAPHSFAFGIGQARIKVGLIGCGGRGTGAAADCFDSSEGIEIVALGDVFKERVDGAANYLKGKFKDAYKVSNDKMFVGFDAYQKVIESGCDLIILATPPGFRPLHLKAAINAGKHVFMEKPIAVDGPGVKMVFDASDMAAAKGLGIVAGTQRRHDLGYNAVMERIHAGDMGEIVSMSCYWNQGGLWMNPRKTEWSDMEWQLRNWLYFTWLSGDHICEQHIHNIDVCNWAMRAHPTKCVALGGRQARTDAAYGHAYDHFAVEYEYGNGVKMHSYCRQQDGTASNVSERIVGTKGTSNPSGQIKGEKAFRFQGDKPNPYMLEHRNLIASIRAGKPLNEGRQVAESTLTAIMGRMAAYTGQEVTWDMALNSKEAMMPATLSMGAIPVAPIAIPGRTPFI